MSLQSSPCGRLFLSGSVTLCWTVLGWAATAATPSWGRTAAAQASPTSSPASQAQQTSTPSSPQPQATAPVTDRPPDVQEALPQPPVPRLYRRTPLPDPPITDHPATITVTTRTVLVDVTVVDRKGNPVAGLKQSDFQILEDSAPQTIDSFHEHTTADPAVAAAEVRQIKTPPNGFTNYVPFGNGNALTVVLLDAASIPLVDQAIVRDDIIAYMKTVPPGHPIAIFQMDTSMHLIQGFTSDPEVLRAATEDKRDTIRMASIYLHQPGYVAAQFRLDLFRAGLRTMARYLAGFPGRKNLIWFTGSLPGLGLGGLNSAFPEIEDYSEELSAASETLALSRVSIYPVAARSLEADPAWGPEHLRAPPLTSGNDFGISNSVDRGMLDQLAEATGGRAFYNTNNFRKVIEQVVDNGSFYYTLAYTPTNKSWNGGYRRIHVSVASNLQGMLLQYRQGYIAHTPNVQRARQTMKQRQQNGLVKAAWAQPLVINPEAPGDFAHAMQLGAIAPTQVLFNTSVSPGTQTRKLDNKAPLPAGDFMRKDFRGKPFREYHLLYGVVPRSVHLSAAPDGKRQGALKFVAVLYNDSGEQVNSVASTLQLDLNPDTYAKVMSGGLGFQQDIAVPLKGNYFLRLGVHDLSNDRVGAMEIPVETIKLNVAGPDQTLTP